MRTGAPENPAGIALAFLHPPRNEPPYSITPATRSGWNLAGARGKPVLAASDNIVLFDTTRVLADFLPDFLVSVALAAQPDLLVVHAASVRIGNSGALLSGRSHAGKTTTSLHLAARGHSLLGDELAAIRLSTGELEHLRRSVRLRPGPRGKSLLSRLLEVGAFDSSPAHCAGTTQLTIGTLFPAPLPRPAKLRAAFFLQGFSEHPALEEIQPTLSDSSIFDALAANDIALVSWGLVPWKRALRLLALKRLLSRTRCWKLSVGKPEDTARLIEQTMEAL